MTKRAEKTHRVAAGIFAAVILISALLTAAGMPSHALEAPELDYSKSACVYNPEYDAYVYESGADDEVYPAGTVKLMTALLALEHFDDYGEKITVTEEMLDGVEGSATGFDAGEEVPVEDLLAALIISNSNDAAMILAYAVSGNSGAFLQLMNERAEELGMDKTRYLNVTGLHNSRMKTSARDVVKVTAEVIKYREFTALASTETYTIAATNVNPERTLHNRNFFISTYYNLYYRLDSVSGVCCSYTGETGYCLSITAADKNGLTYIFAVMNSDESSAGDNDVRGCDDAVKLMNWTFRNHSSVAVIDTGSMICELPVRLSSGTDHVIALPAKRITALLPDDTDLSQAVRTEYTLTDETLTAPVSAGQIIGELTVYLNGRELGKVDLVAKNNVDRSLWLYVADRVGQFFKRPAVIAIIVAFVAISVILGVRSAARRNRRAVRYKDK